MYVLCAPCILNPALRSDGITKPSDLTLFSRARERCSTFGIDMVPLPCPETLYLGSGRSPGTFLERLDSPEFACLIEELAAGVSEIIEKRGPPICILGVNSSPTCGVTSTYYGARGSEPPKRAGRGVFLAKFPQSVAYDVGTFSRYRVYLAAPLFSAAERSYNQVLAGLLRQNLFEVFLPQEQGDNALCRGREEQKKIFGSNMNALKEADIVVAVIDGADADSGTSWEMGFAAALGKTVFSLRTDFRRSGSHEMVNLMLEESSHVACDTVHLLGLMKSPLQQGTDA